MSCLLIKKLAADLLFPLPKIQVPDVNAKSQYKTAFNKFSFFYELSQHGMFKVITGA